jgi:hypothetical protein
MLALAEKRLRRATRKMSPSLTRKVPSPAVTLEAKAAGLLDGVPADFVFESDGVAYAGADVGALAWTFGPNGSPVARGIDIITVTDGRISSLRTLLHE